MNSYERVSSSLYQGRLWTLWTSLLLGLILLLNLAQVDGNRYTPKLRWTDRRGEYNMSEFEINEFQHQTVKLECPTDPDDTEVVWLKNGERNWNRDSSQRKPTMRKDFLRMENVIAAYDEGDYKCIVKRKDDRRKRPETLERTYKLIVIIQNNAPPALTHIPPNQTLVEGDSTKLECLYVSSQYVVVQWLKHDPVNGTYYDEKGVPLSSVRARPDEIGQDVLELKNVTLNDTGLYSCYLTSITATLGVFGFTYIEVLPRPPLALNLQSTHRLAVAEVASIVIGGILALVILIVVALSVALYCWRTHKPNRHYVLMRNNPLYFRINALLGSGGTAARTSEAEVVRLCDLDPADAAWEVPRENVKLGELLGEGEYGMVYKGLMGSSQEDQIIVAVKMIRGDAVEHDRADLMEELKIMKNIGKHVNIINLIGCCTLSNGPLQILFEFAVEGNLRDYLRKRRPPNMNSTLSLADTDLIDSASYQSSLDLSLTEALIGREASSSHALCQRDLISFAYQVARGMEFLASKEIVHRDLAARNVLVSDNMVLKIADFGLTRDISGRDYYRHTTSRRMPMRWIAIEAFKNKIFTTKSDVWAFGILLWEIFTFGQTPYKEIHVEHLLMSLNRGYRLKKPRLASNQLYNIMTKCWLEEPSLRSDFSTLVRILDSLLSQSSTMEYLHLADSESQADRDSMTEDTLSSNVFSSPPSTARVDSLDRGRGLFSPRSQDPSQYLQPLSIHVGPAPPQSWEERQPVLYHNDSTGNELLLQRPLNERGQKLEQNVEHESTDYSSLWSRDGCRQSDDVTQCDTHLYDEVQRRVKVGRSQSKCSDSQYASRSSDEQSSPSISVLSDSLPRSSASCQSDSLPFSSISSPVVTCESRDVINC